MRKLMRVMNVVEEKKNVILKALSVLAGVATAAMVFKYAVELFRLLLNIEDELMAIRKLSFKNYMASKFRIKRDYDVNIDDFIEKYQDKVEEIINNNAEYNGLEAVKPTDKEAKEFDEMDTDMKEAEDFVVED